MSGVLIVTMGIVAITAACGGFAANREPLAQARSGIPFREIYAGTLPASGQREHLQGRVLCGAREVRVTLAAWRMDEVAPGATSVDFSDSCVLAILAGSQPSSGFRVRIVGITVREDHVAVTVTVARPAGINDAMTVSRPYTVATVPRNAVAQARGEALVHRSA